MSAKKPRVTNVKINWSENNELDNERPQWSSLIDADMHLFSVAHRKQNGGCDKTNFTITFSDGETYTGRLDLKNDDYSIREHVRSFLTFLAGRAFPAHLTREQYNDYLQQQKPGLVEEAGQWLDNREWN